MLKKKIEEKPSLYGLKNTNRDFTKKKYWGKNQFNSSFPMALLCYMESLNISAVYIKVDENMSVIHEKIDVNTLFGEDVKSPDLFFSFETAFTRYQKYVEGNIPRNDITLLDKDTGNPINTFEIKLTALPDNQTCELSEEEYGSEIVIRPDTIIYQACSIIDRGDKKLLKKLYSNEFNDVKDWSDEKEVLKLIPKMKEILYKLVEKTHKKQYPLLLQPIWKTKGKSPVLEENCLDVFVWSDLSLIKLYEPINLEKLKKIDRPTRTMVWLTKMLKDYVANGAFNGEEIIDKLSYNTKNDKAFSIGGNGTHKLMKSEELRKPRIKRTEIAKIILGGGQNLLSPERRFDAIIFNSMDLFKRS